MLLRSDYVHPVKLGSGSNDEHVKRTKARGKEGGGEQKDRDTERDIVSLGHLKYVPETGVTLPDECTTHHKLGQSQTQHISEG